MNVIKRTRDQAQKSKAIFLISFETVKGRETDFPGILSGVLRIDGLQNN